jgi:DNA ligase 1
MQFAELVAAYERLEATTKRLEMREILVRLIRSAPAKELPEILYLSQGLLRPEYEGVELGVADSLLRRAITQATGASEAQVARHVRDSGDLGITAAALLEPRTTGRVAPRSVSEVYRQFLEIARASGSGSQEVKVRALVELVEHSTPLEAKYVVRFALGTLRLGVREMTILDALAEAFAGGTKADRTRIEAAFNVCSDLGLVAGALVQNGLTGLEQIHLTVGRPIRPMLAERSPDLEEVLKRMEDRTALEYKYDGLRIQAHVPEHGPPTLFSRRLENVSQQFPELVEELPRAIGHRPAIVEGECVSVDPDTDELRPFQEISRRRGRKYDLERMQSEVPVRLFVFDVLLENGESTVELDFPVRRERLERMVTETERVRKATQRVVATIEEASAFFDEAIAEGCEGVMAKSVAPGSAYRAGARGFWWIKYKREYTHALADSIDGVVVGGFYGRGRRAGTFGALLLAVYNPEADQFESFCKVGSGFDDAQLAELPKRLQPFLLSDRPDGVETGLAPDAWMRPKVVLEVRGAELSLSPIHRAGSGLVRPGAGFALRFPRFTGRYREDKGPTEATTPHELLEMYRSQVRHEPARRPDASA